mgnify:CR=1 FL=1
MTLPAGIPLPGIPGLPSPGIPLPFGLTLPLDWTLPTNWKLPANLPLPENLPLPIPPENVYAKGVLIAWTKTDGKASAVYLDYGTTAADFSPVWSIRDSRQLRAFRDWWNLSGYKPAASTNTGSGLDMTYPTPDDIDALTAWGKNKTLNPPLGWNVPPTVPQGLSPALAACALACEKNHGFGSSKPDPVAVASCLAACAGGATPGGGAAPPGGGGGGAEITCPEGQILSAGICQPKLPPAMVKPPQEPAKAGVSSNTGLLIAGAVVLAAVGLFAATVGAAGGAAVASGGGRSSNPRKPNPNEIHFKRGDKLNIRAHRSEPGKGLSYGNMVVTASEDGRGGQYGGWDVYDGVTDFDEEVSFYGFSVESKAVRPKRRA